MCGQCYDGSTNMSGAKNGYKSIVQVQEHALMATYIHCAPHRLSLAIVSAYNTQNSKAWKLVLEKYPGFSSTQLNGNVY